MASFVPPIPKKPKPAPAAPPVKVPPLRRVRTRQAQAFPNAKPGSDRVGQVRLIGWRHGHMAGVGRTLYYELELPAPMDREALCALLFEGGKLPMFWTVAPLPDGSNTVTSRWLVGGPYYRFAEGGKSFFSAITGTLGQDLERQFLASDLPPSRAAWLSQATVEALEKTGAPPAGADVKLAPGHGSSVYVWREGEAWFWFDTATGEVQGFRRDPSRTDAGSRRYDDWVIQNIERGQRPDDAMDQTVEDMHRTNVAILGAFGMGLAGAGGVRKPQRERISLPARDLRSKPPAQRWLLGEKPTGPAAFEKVARLPGGQAEKASLFERLARELKERTGWNASRTGTAVDGSIVYHGEAQLKALVITPDGRVFTATWGQHVRLQAVDGVPRLVCDWKLPGWKQW